MDRDEQQFHHKRKEIFKSLVRLAFNNQLKEKINNIPPYFAKNKTELALIKDEILTALGLDPGKRFDTELARAVDAALNLKEIKEPLITINRRICKECEEASCPVRCLHHPAEGLMIEDNRCIACGKCLSLCPRGAISDKIQFIPLVKYLQNESPVYAHVAPAIVGQFGPGVSIGRLRSALKSIGFTDLVEVALFADILTLREADEYNKLVRTEDDFLITSCCCPVWINLLTRHYPELSQQLTKTVSPMIASGRLLKAIFPEAITVFIGPCLAKKGEAKVPELKGAIDYVMTFDELNQVFTALNINLSQYQEDNKEQSSFGGRIYGKTGGVSEAVRITVERINPRRELDFKAVQADGVRECKELLDNLRDNKTSANFIEGMGCEGGCVGGPRTNITVDEGTRHLINYSMEATVQNPIDNMNITHILKYFSSIDQLKSQKIDQLSFDRILLWEYERD